MSNRKRLNLWVPGTAMPVLTEWHSSNRRTSNPSSSTTLAPTRLGHRKQSTYRPAILPPIPQSTRAADNATISPSETEAATQGTCLVAGDDCDTIVRKGKYSAKSGCSTIILCGALFTVGSPQQNVITLL